MAEFPYEILSDEDLRKKMSVLAQEYDELRREHIELTATLVSKQAAVQLGITYLEPSVFTNDKVIRLIKSAAIPENKIKLHQPDKDALTRLELGKDLARQITLETAISTNDKAYDKYQKLISYSQSEMKLR